MSGVRLFAALPNVCMSAICHLIVSGHSRRGASARAAAGAAALALILPGTTRSAVAQLVPDVAASAAQRARPGGALRLNEVIARATTQVPLVAAARARVAAARGARRSAATLSNPVVTYWREDVGLPGRRYTPPLEAQTQTYVTVPLEPIFQRAPRLRAADALVGAAAADLARARQVVALEAARAFFRVATAQVAVEAADEVRDRLAELVRYTGARVREGATAAADLMRAQIELDRVATTAALGRVELARARAGLAPYLGPVPAPADTSAANASLAAGDWSADSIRVVLDDHDPQPGERRAVEAALRPLPELLETASALRPDVIAARERAAAARAEVGYQRTLTVRQLGATFGSKRTPDGVSALLALSVPVPLFDRNRGEIERAAALRTAAEQELAWTERQAAAEVRAAYDAARLLAAQSARLRGSFLGRAEESRRIALAAYREGAVSLLQVLDASRTLADARQMYYRTVIDERQSVLELRVAIGDTVLARTPGAAAASSSRGSTGRP